MRQEIIETYVTKFMDPQLKEMEKALNKAFSPMVNFLGEGEKDLKEFVKKTTEMAREKAVEDINKFSDEEIISLETLTNNQIVAKLHQIGMKQMQEDQDARCLMAACECSEENEIAKIIIRELGPKGELN
jgi:anion-transporting  ArsA/GET3 family ATPase